MNNTVFISVSARQKKKSHGAKHVNSMLKARRFKGVELKSISAVYRLEGGYGIEDVRKAAEEILSDPVVEEYFVNAAPKDAQTYFADVWYKPGVTDTVGDSVLKAMRDLMLDTFERAFSGTRYEFYAVSSGTDGNLKDKIAEFASGQLLNPLVQECKITKL